MLINRRLALFYDSLPGCYYGCPLCAAEYRRRVGRFVVYLLLAVVLFASAPASAQGVPYPVNPHAMEMAIRDAVRLSRYPVPWGKNVNLHVRVVANGVLSTPGAMCPSGCGPRASYAAAPLPEAPNVDFIYVELGVMFLAPADAHGLMVHEAMHFLQRWNDTDWTSCAAELEATEVQNLFLAEVRQLPVPLPECMDFAGPP